MMKSPGLTQENILYINFEDERLSIFLQTVWEKYWMPISSYIQKKPLIYLDEIQVVYGWENLQEDLQILSIEL